MPSKRNSKRHEQRSLLHDVHLQVSAPVKAKKDRVEPLTDGQRLYFNSINVNDVTFGVGCSGTGKTYLATRLASEFLDDKVVRRVIVTRPIVGAEEEIGYLPGDMSEKTDPWFRPVKDVMENFFGVSHFENLVRNKVVEFCPLAFMRGATFNDAFVILDEAQNVTVGQMKLLLTRFGERSKLVINGDICQKDISVPSGLEDALYKFRDVRGVGVVQLGKDDIVRSGFVRTVLDLYEPEENYRYDYGNAQPKKKLVEAYADKLNDEGLMRFLGAN